MNEGITCYERDEVLCDDQICIRRGCRRLNKRLGLPQSPEKIRWLNVVRETLEAEGLPVHVEVIDRTIADVEALVKALEDLQQTAGAVATWLNHWELSFAGEIEWRGPTGDGQLFFDALNKAAAALAAYRSNHK